MTDDTTLVTVIGTAAAVAFVVLAAWHVWYALGLSRVLAARGVEGWRAWVPLLGDAEVLRLGRIDPVRIVLVLVPVVAVYGVVLRAIAAHRLNVGAGRGAGTTVLAVLLPPVWATVLAGAEPLGEDAVTVDEVHEPEDEPFALVPATALPAIVAPAAPAALPVTTPASAASLSAPARVGEVPTALTGGGAPAPQTGAAAALAAEPTSLRRRTRVEPVEEAEDETALAGAAAPADETAMGDATSLAGSPRDWELVLASGETLPLTARTIVLGRKPQARRGEAQYVTVDDDTRTVSKEHAQLQWASDRWTLSDLGSVNGVTVVDARGAETRIGAEEAVVVEGIFLLGDARLELRRTAR